MRIHITFHYKIDYNRRKSVEQNGKIDTRLRYSSRAHSFAYPSEYEYTDQKRLVPEDETEHLSRQFENPLPYVQEVMRTLPYNYEHDKSSYNHAVYNAYENPRKVDLTMMTDC